MDLKLTQFYELYTLEVIVINKKVLNQFAPFMSSSNQLILPTISSGKTILEHQSMNRKYIFLKIMPGMSSVKLV